MTVGEATRQYQAVIEARRSLHAEVGDMHSFGDVLESADRQVADAREAVNRAWLEAARRGDTADSGSKPPR